MGSEFTPVFFLLLMGILVSIGMVAASAVVGPWKRTVVKQMPYESGMDPVGDARQRFDVRFALVAIVFLLFDVELLFLYPWAVAQWSADKPVTVVAGQIQDGTSVTTVTTTSPSVGIPADARWLVFAVVVVVVILLTAADVYAWKKGVFEWK